MRTMRTVALIVCGIVAGSLAILVALGVWLGGVRGLVVGIAAAAVVVGLYVTVVGPWQRRWGTTDAELARRMPGDEFLGRRAASTTRAITIEARPEDVFPWLLQIGYGRGGWYSYDWIDNDGRPSVREIRPDLQRLAIGDRIVMVPGMGPVVRDIVPNHHVVSGGDTDSWCLLLEPGADGTTRLLSRWRERWPRTIATRAWIAIADPGAFVMEQRMLRTIRDLAERDVRRSA